MQGKKLEIDLTSLGPVLKPLLPKLLSGLTIVVSTLLAVGAALQKLDLEMNGGKDAVPRETGNQSADTAFQYDWEGK